MIESGRRVSTRTTAMAIGLTVAVAGCLAVSVHVYDRLDDFGFDIHLRNVGDIKAHPDIVLIDIDDGALRSVGDWPWPRRRSAQLLDTLSQAGADMIVLDLVFADPSAPRTAHAGLGANYDVDPPRTILGNPLTDPPIYDDDELAGAIRRAGNVYLSMYFRLREPGSNWAVIRDRARVVLAQDPAMTPAAFRNALGVPPARLNAWSAATALSVEDLYCQEKLVHLLMQDFSLGVEDLETRFESSTNSSDASMTRHVLFAKETVAFRRARSFLTANPADSFASFYGMILPGADVDAFSPDRELLVRSFRKARALQTVIATNPPLPKPITERLMWGDQITPPLDKLAQAAKGIGFVAFPRETSGAVVRELPLLARTKDATLFQLGFLVASDRLGIDRTAIRLERGGFATTSEDRSSVWPISAEGLTTIPWHRSRRSDRWQDSFTHVPADRVLEIPLNVEAMIENEKRYRLELAELVRRRFADTPAEYAEYVRLLNAWSVEPGSLDPAAEGTQVTVDPDARESAKQAIAKIEADAMAWLARSYLLWEKAEPQTDEERVERDEVLRWHAMFSTPTLRASTDILNGRLEARNQELLADLRERVEGKICLVGYTASGAADLVSSPVYPSLPGVLVHANVVNMFLQHAPMFRIRPSIIALLVGVVGLVMAFIAGTYRPLVAVVMLFLVSIACVVVGVVLFRISSSYVATVVIVLHTSLVWAAVTVYRQFTEERARRRFQLALSQYTSPAVAARIADRAKGDELAPQLARVTCFFSDLYGFSTLSERLGAQRTRDVLNPYLQTMSEVLVAHDALVNKFIGDGIFAFFNAPVLPRETHSAAACDSALASVSALERLVRRKAPDDPTLRMRIGLSTGDVFVGDYGSRTKLDYTCIGDTVNLGARLERLNKMFQTDILIDQATRDDAGEPFVFRTIGRVQVAGRKQPVDVFELIGRSDTVDSSAEEYAACFGDIVRYFQSADWDRCSTSLATCRAMNPDDKVTQAYADAIENLRRRPPGNAWDGTLPLLER